MIDDADDHEQRRLEERVRDHHAHAGEGTGLGAHADHEDHESELGDGAVGEQQLEVSLPESSPASDDHRRGTQREHDGAPVGDRRERRREHRHQVHACLHHRGSVEVGGDRRRGGHRARQPEVERDEGRFRQGSDEHQHRADAGEHARRRVGGDGGQRIRASFHAQRHDAEQHRQTACSRDDHGRRGSATVRPPRRVVADQQVGEDRREFPEDEQDDEVVGGHEAQHGSGEGEQHPARQ